MRSRPSLAKEVSGSERPHKCPEEAKPGHSGRASQGVGFCLARRGRQRPRSRHDSATNQAVLDKLLGDSSPANANGLTPRGGRARAGALLSGEGERMTPPLRWSPLPRA